MEPGRFGQFARICEAHAASATKTPMSPLFG
jgi:hypothetical protein